MKKKYLLGLLVILGIFTITGCGSYISKEDMLSQAKDLSVDMLVDDLELNFKNAKEKYTGNVYQITAGVMSVEDNFAKLELYGNDYTEEYLKVYFDSDDLKILNANSKIQFVGTINEIDKNDDKIIVTIKNAYFISDYIQITGQIKCWSSSKRCELYEGSYDEEHATYELRDDVLNVSTFGAKINDVQVNNDDIITLTAKVKFDQQDFWNVTDIKEVKVN